MKNNKGFVISTTLYSIFGIMLLVVFYILYLLANNRMVLSSTIKDLKESLEYSKRVHLTFYVDENLKSDLESELNNLSLDKTSIDYTITEINQSETVVRQLDKDIQGAAGQTSLNHCPVIVNKYAIATSPSLDSDQMMYYVDIFDIYSNKVYVRGQNQIINDNIYYNNPPYHLNTGNHYTTFTLDRDNKILYMYHDYLTYTHKWDLNSDNYFVSTTDSPITNADEIVVNYKLFSALYDSENQPIVYYTPYTDTTMTIAEMRDIIETYTQNTEFIEKNKDDLYFYTNNFIKYGADENGNIIYGLVFYDDWAAESCFHSIWFKDVNAIAYSLDSVGTPSEENYDENYFILINNANNDNGDSLTITDDSISTISYYDYSLIYTNDEDATNKVNNSLINSKNSNYSNITDTINNIKEVISNNE